MKPGQDVLRSLPIFRSCGDALLSQLNDIADVARLGPDEVLFRAGDVLPELTILIAGKALTTAPRHAGEDAIADVVFPVRPLGLAAALQGRPSPAGARTLTSAAVCLFPIEPLKAVWSRFPELASAFLDCALQELESLVAETHDLKLKNTAERLAGYLLRLAGGSELAPARFVLPIEKQYIAAMLGCSQENLSRALAALRRFGVETRQGVAIIQDLPGLRAFAALRAPGSAARNADVL